MARDTREAILGLDRNKYYKGTVTANNKLTRSTTVLGIFYSRDVEPIRMFSEINNGFKHTKKTAKLVTRDYIPNLEIDDYVHYNNEYWLVDSIDVADIADNAKPYTRHSNETIIGLRQ